jgi:hypothetical protein
MKKTSSSSNVFWKIAFLLWELSSYEERIKIAPVQVIFDSGLNGPWMETNLVCKVLDSLRKISGLPSGKYF